MVDFLQIQDVLLLHGDQVDRYGGEHGVRDLALLESAVAQPQATFGGEFLHKDLFEMAAAYLFHIVQNHPLVDGNKRTALGAAVLFLAANGYELTETGTAELADLVLEMVVQKRDKAWVADQLRQRARPR